MFVQIYCVRDSKSEAYLQPMFFATNAAAIRAFQDVINDGKSNFSKHPEDYTMFHIGSYDDASGTLVSMNPESVVKAVDLVNPVS